MCSFFYLCILCIRNNNNNNILARPSSFLLAAKRIGPDWLGGFTPFLHHHRFGFPSTFPAPPLPDLLWYLLSSPVATASPQSSTCLGVTMWISMLDVVKYEQDRVREEGRANSEARERTKAEHKVQSTFAAAVLYMSVYFYHMHITHTHKKNTLTQPLH